MIKVDLSHVAPYGDKLGDGKVQVSFTLPVEKSEEAKEAATQLMIKMGLENVLICEMRSIGEQFTFFVGYGALKHTIDFAKIHVPKIEKSQRSYQEVNDRIREILGRQIVVVGAATGSDAHTVGIDAILNMKGVAGSYGLERYPMMKVFNMGAQVTNEELIEKAKKEKADAILISQIVTANEIHLHNLAAFLKRYKNEPSLKDTLIIIGGPRLGHKLALELGFDAGFGTQTLPRDVANYLVDEIVVRKKGLSGK